MVQIGLTPVYHPFSQEFDTTIKGDIFSREFCEEMCPLNFLLRMAETLVISLQVLLDGTFQKKPFYKMLNGSVA